MTRERYEFLWRHFHISAPDNSSSRPEEDEEGSVEEDLVEIKLERVELEEEENNVSVDGADDDDEEEDSDDGHEVWFTKLEKLIDHVREVSYNLIHTLGSYLSLDDLMIRFMGR